MVSEVFFLKRFVPQAFEDLNILVGSGTHHNVGVGVGKAV